MLIVSLALLLFLSACASYPLSRFKFKLNKPIYAIIVACMSVPVHVTLLPIFLMTTKVGLYDSPWALVGQYVAFNLPISVFILVTFMQAIPRELEEAAEIDGCNKYNNFANTVLSDKDAKKYVSGVGYQWGGKHALLQTKVAYPEYYLMRHFSKYVKQGAVMKGLKGDFAGNALAFENPDGSVVLELLNPFDETQDITFNLEGVNYNFNVKPHSFNTLVL